MKRVLNIAKVVLIALAALLLLVLLCGSLFGGCAVKCYVNNHGEELLGRRMSVDGVGVNLFTGRVSVKGLTVFEEDATTTFAGFDTLDVGVSLLRLVGRTVYVRHVALSGLEVEVLQNGSHFNFTSIIDHFRQDTTRSEEVEDTVPGGWVVSLHDMKIQRGRVRYADLQRQSDWGMNDLNLVVPDFTIGGEESTDAGLALAFADGGQLGVRAALNPADNHFNLAVDLEGFALDQVRPYLVNVAHVDRLKGSVGIAATATGWLDSLANVDLKVKAHIDNVELRDRELGDVLSLRHLGLDAEQIVPGKNIYNINSVSLEGVRVKYELFSDSSNTFSRLLAQDQTAPAPDDTAQAAVEADTSAVAATQSPLRLRVGKLSTKDVNFVFADHTLPDPFEFAVTNIMLSAENLSSAGNNNARLLASLPNGGKAIVDWQGNISDWKLNHRLLLNIKNLHLTDLSPYLVAYFGMPFTDGVFSFTSLNTIKQSQLRGDNKIDIFKPTLGDKRPDVKPQLHLPIRAALYVLKDKDQKVILPVPVSGNIDSPKFNYMKLVWKTLGNLIVKVVTSPITSSDSLTLDKDGNVFIAVDADEHDFTSQQFYQIDKVAELAKIDEAVTLNFTLVSSPEPKKREAENHERRNKILRHHLAELGVAEKQIVINAADTDSDHPDEGYIVKITSE